MRWRRYKKLPDSRLQMSEMTQEERTCPRRLSPQALAGIYRGAGMPGEITTISTKPELHKIVSDRESTF